MAQTCGWAVGPTETIDFEVFDKNDGWAEQPGLYIFACQQGDDWRALYIGQADSLAARLPQHERLPEAIDRGATHIHARVVPQKDRRDRWEQALISMHQPPLNSRHR